MIWWMIGGVGSVAVLAVAIALSVSEAVAVVHRYEPRHQLADPEPGPPVYGAMILAEEQRIMLPRLGAHLVLWGNGHSCDSAEPHDGPCVCECGVVQPYDGPDWREQTAADLSPEALGTCDWGDCDELAGFWRTDEKLGPLPVCDRHQDPGPGDLSSLTPGPDQRVCSTEQVTWRDSDLLGPSDCGEETRAANRILLTRLADTADVMDARLLAEVTAFMRRQDAETAAYLAWRDEEFRLDLAAALV